MELLAEHEKSGGTTLSAKWTYLNYAHRPMQSLRGAFSTRAYVSWGLDPALKGRATRRKPLCHPAMERRDYGRG